MDTKNMNVYQKIVEVKKVAKSLRKSGKGFGYKYTTAQDVYNKITDKMNELGLLFLIVQAEAKKTYTFEYKNEKGDMKTDFVIEGKCQFAWVNADNPNSDRHEINGDYFGQQADISQAYGSALTYFERYALLKSLGLPTDESDPNAKPESQRPAGETKYDKMLKLLKNSRYVIADAGRWILKKHGRDIRINDLTDEQFNEMFDAFAGELMKNGNQV